MDMRFADKGSLLRFGDGETIFAEGDPAQSVYIVVSGGVEIRKPGEPVATVVAELGPGDVFGESALLADRPRSAQATAMGETELACYDRDTFLDAIRSDPDLAVRIISTLAERLHVATERLHRLATQHVLDKTDIALTEKAVLESELS
jgi:CRP-like cAMP-binding protein